MFDGSALCISLATFLLKSIQVVVFSKATMVTSHQLLGIANLVPRPSLAPHERGSGISC